MDDEQVATTDQNGIARTTDGTIADPAASNQNTNQDLTTQQTDGKTLLTEKEAPQEGDKKSETGKAPDKYEDYKVPDGFTLDPAVKTKADAVFKELGLSQDNAQKLVDMYSELTTEAAKAPYAAWEEMANNWKTEAEAHPDLKGKLGPGQEVNVRIAKLLDGMNDPQLASDFRKVMDITMAGNHQAFIRVLDYAAKRLTEGTHVAGNGPTKAGQSRPGEAPPTAAGALWPNLPSAGGGR